MSSTFLVRSRNILRGKRARCQFHNTEIGTPVKELLACSDPCTVSVGHVLSLLARVSAFSVLIDILPTLKGEVLALDIHLHNMCRHPFDLVVEMLQMGGFDGITELSHRNRRWLARYNTLF